MESRTQDSRRLGNEIRVASLTTSLFVTLIIFGRSATPGPSAPSAPSGSAAPPAGEAVSSVGADPLPSWNDGPAKQAIINFAKTTTDKASTQFVAPEDRIATFDQDGTLWVEHPT